MSHIEIAIGIEAARARDDWESDLSGPVKVAESERVDIDLTAPPPLPPQDNYCFEMLSLVIHLLAQFITLSYPLSFNVASIPIYINKCFSF